MQSRIGRVAILLAAGVLCGPLGSAQITKIALDHGWEFRQQTADAQWRAAQVPGDVHLDLLRNKLIPDPFYRDNEAKLQWVENADWAYRTSLDITPALLARQHLELVFDGLDAYAEVQLNGKLVLTADNQFRTWRVDAKPYLVSGANRLQVLFPSPIRSAARLAAADKSREKTKAEEKTYIRKAAYEYGWDWGPRFVTSGIWRPARLEVWDTARIADFHIRQRDITRSVAHINAEVDIESSGDTDAKVTVTWPAAETSRTVHLHAGSNHIDLPVEIERPKLWYPAGYGAQALYDFRARVAIGPTAADEAAVRTGLRSIVLRRDLDQWGRSFEFIVNGIPVFGKGADVIPFDSFPNRVTTAQYRRVLESARDANMNMVRHWGGGYYETDEFYQICDELGIMVWQDFMFGNDWQPGYYPWVLNVAREAEDQVRRLRNHPSIVLWCGNNETEGAFGWKGRDQYPADARLRMWQDYLTVFSGVLPRAVERLTPETPYWPSSPSADYEETSDAYQTGDMHDWTVWHGRVPFSTYEQHFPRFMTEYGFQSFPEMPSIETFTLPEDRASIFTPVMLAHQKNAAGNSIIHDYLLKDYSEPKDFASFLYVSQILQAEGIKIGAEHLRRSRPRSMGSIYWQLNDCWPVASWASLDYQGHWKALQYYAKRFYNPVLVSPHVEDGALAVYVVSDNTEPAIGSLRVRILNFDGTVVKQSTQNVTVPALSSSVFVRLPLSELNTDLTKVFATADLSVAGKRVSSNVVYLVPTAQIHLAPAHITAELSGTGLRLTSPVLARSVRVTFGSLDARLADNYFDLLPGEPLELAVSGAPLDQLRQSLQVFSLVDAFKL